MRIVLAGAETWWLTFMGAGVRNQLYSYYYMRSMRGRKLTSMVEAMYNEKQRRVDVGEKPLFLFLDSGGFTYTVGAGSKIPPAMYFKDYLEFLKSTKDLWDVAAELDIEESSDVNVSLDQVDDWREEMFATCASQTLQILPVWHDNRGMDIWQTYCDDSRFPYLAVGSGFDVGIKNRLCGMAHKSGKLVHGFAETKLQTDMKYLKFDSVDSSTWLRATRYGGMFIFHGNQLRILDHKHKGDRRLFRAYFLKNGIDMAKIMAEDQAELTKCSLIAWRNLSDRYEQMGKMKGQRNEEKSNNDSGCVPKAELDGGHWAEADVCREPELGQEIGVKPKLKVIVKPRIKAPVVGKPGIKIVVPRSAQLCPTLGQNIIETSSMLGAWPSMPDPNSPSTWQGSDGKPRCVRARRHVGRTKHMFSDHEIKEIREIGERCGCWECGAKTSGLKSGNWILDHYPFYSDEDLKKDKPLQVLVPHCQECSNSQGGKAVANRGSKYAKLAVKKLGCSDPILGIQTPTADIVVPTFYCGYPKCNMFATSAHVVEAQLVQQVTTHMLEAHGPGSLRYGILTLKEKEIRGGHTGVTGEAYTTSEKSAASKTLGEGKKAEETSRNTLGVAVSSDVPQETAGVYNDAENARQMNSEGNREESREEEEGTKEGTDVGTDVGIEENVEGDIAHTAGSSQGAQGPSSEVSRVPTQSGEVGFFRLPVLQHAPVHEASLKRLQSGLPALSCSSCAMNAECPEAQEGSACYFDPMFKLLPVRDISAHLATLEHLLEWDKERTYRALLNERLSTGGQIDPRVSAQLDSFINRLTNYEERIRGSMPASPTASATLSASGPGILSQLFRNALPQSRGASDEILNEPGRSLPNETVEIKITKPM